MSLNVNLIGKGLHNYHPQAQDNLKGYHPSGFTLGENSLSDCPSECFVSLSTLVCSININIAMLHVSVVSNL